MSIRYEDLLDNTEELVIDIYRFIGENIDTRDIKPIISKIKKGNYNKWASRMSPSQVKLFEKVSGDVLRNFGYKTSHQGGGINWIEKFLYISHEKLFKIIFLLKLNIIDGIKIKLFGKEPFAD